jgi:hypothetical protein
MIKSITIIRYMTFCFIADEENETRQIASLTPPLRADVPNNRGARTGVRTAAFEKATRTLQIEPHMTLLPRMKASPYLARSCPSTYLRSTREEERGRFNILVCRR